MKKKINNSGTTDIFFEQLENSVHIESKDIPFGKEYHFKDFTSNKNPVLCSPINLEIFFFYFFFF